MGCEQERTSFGYPPDVRVRLRKRYLAIQNGGERIHTRHFIVFIASGETDKTRIGITASRRIGNAVVRNRWKRIVRESFRHVQYEIERTLDMVFVVRRGVSIPTLEQVQTDMRHAVNTWCSSSRSL